MTKSSSRQIAIPAVHLESYAIAPATRAANFRPRRRFEGEAILIEVVPCAAVMGR